MPFKILYDFNESVLNSLRCAYNVRHMLAHVYVYVQVWVPYIGIHVFIVIL